MFYEIIKNESELDKFLDFLPDLQEGEKFMIALFARNKFKKTDGLTADKTQIKRFTCTKKNIKQKLRQLEVKLGNFTFEKNGVYYPINQDSLVIYITPNPRDMYGAVEQLDYAMALARKQKRKIYNIHSEALSCIQTTSSRKLFYDWDIDIKPGQELSVEELAIWLDGKINVEAVKGIIKTRGGYHVLISLQNISTEFFTKWYNNFTAGDPRFDIMANKDNMLPLPGCVQSDTYPILIK